MAPSDPTVLVVEDHDDLRAAYAAWLAERATVRTAGDGSAALSALDGSVDVVFLDRDMPGASGVEVLAEIRDRGVDPRVAMVTAVDPDFDVVEMEFDDYLTKPVRREEFLDALETLLALDRYDERLGELYAAAAKLAALETAKSRAELARSEEYARLRERVEWLEDTTRRTVEEVDVEWSRLLVEATSPGSA